MNKWATDSWNQNNLLARSFYVLLVASFSIACLGGFISAPQSLICGIFVGNLPGSTQSFARQSQIFSKLTTWSLWFAVMGLGAGMKIDAVASQGLSSFFMTIFFIFTTLAIGKYWASVLKIEPEVSLLISSGTAICGGSAIAAVASSIRAKSENISVSLGCVFLLNSIALLIFPAFGKWLHLDQVQFGVWSALSIHDTSSVVAAGYQYGQEALHVATTTKLVRALWIAPLSLYLGIRHNHQFNWNILKRQWFIVGFILISMLFTWNSDLSSYREIVVQISKRLMVFSVFLIGASLTIGNLRKVGIRPLIHSITLWISIAIISLIAVMMRWI